MAGTARSSWSTDSGTSRANEGPALRLQRAVPRIAAPSRSRSLRANAGPTCAWPSSARAPRASNNALRPVLRCESSFSSCGLTCRQFRLVSGGLDAARVELAESLNGSQDLIARGAGCELSAASDAPSCATRAAAGQQEDGRRHRCFHVAAVEEPRQQLLMVLAQKRTPGPSRAASCEEKFCSGHEPGARTKPGRSNAADGDGKTADTRFMADAARRSSCIRSGAPRAYRPCSGGARRESRMPVREVRGRPDT